MYGVVSSTSKIESAVEIYKYEYKYLGCVEKWDGDARTGDVGTRGRGGSGTRGRGDSGTSGVGDAATHFLSIEF